MSKEAEEPRYHIIQPLRDPESNWAVDLAKDLEEYLVKICSGDVTGDDEGHLSINFAEAALILQGSVQVYSRKVEYLYKLVLQALEVLSQKSRQQDQTEESSAIPEGHDSNAVLADENEPFLGLDDVPVDAKSCLDDGRTKGHTSNQFVKPPANLVVLEGDCFDSIGDVGELESYLLATHDLYRDFILLDPYDAGSVDKYLEEEDFGGNNVAQRGSQVKAKTPRSAFLSPSRQFGGTAHKSPLAKSVGKNANRTPEITRNAEINDNIWPDPSAGFGFPENDYHGEDDNDGYPESMDESDDDEDPWRPLNPHETGNLKVKPFQKVKIRRRLKVTTNKLMSLASQFPVARLHGVINPEYKDIWETQLHEKKSVQESEALPLYEKLRQSLAGNDNFDTFTNHVEDNDDNEDENDAPDFGEADFTMPESSFMDAAGPLNHEMKDGPADFDNNGFETEDPDFQISLEDLCRSHLDALLASIAETEKQTELAARVSTWKQRIEGTLEEQDSHPPFDIQEYGERVLNKLSLEGESGNGMSFADVVRGQEKHDVARTFSALLQLVNNRSVDLDRGECSSQSVCYTAVNPFYVRPLTQSHINRTENMIFRSKKRGKSPMLKSVSKTARKKSYL